jgi:hypothetical protein
MNDPTTLSNKELLTILADRLGVSVEELAKLAGVPIEIKQDD